MGGSSCELDGLADRDRDRRARLRRTIAHYRQLQEAGDDLEALEHAVVARYRAEAEAAAAANREAARLEAALVRRVLRPDRLPRERIRMLAADARSGVEVITAHDLAPAAVPRWTAELAGRLGEPPGVAFHTDAGLIAGAEQRLGSAVVTFSWRDALGRARDLVEGHAVAG